MNDEKFDVALEIKVPSSNVIKAVDDRDVFVHPGDISTSQVVDVHIKTPGDSYISGNQYAASKRK